MVYAPPLWIYLLAFFGAGRGGEEGGGERGGEGTEKASYFQLSNFILF